MGERRSLLRALASREDVYMTPREVFSHGAELAEMGLGVPAMNRVFSRLAALGLDVDSAVYTVDQAKASFLAALGRKEGT